MNTIESFHGEYRWLSNFWPARVFFDGFWYASVEHAYQAAKTVSDIEREMMRAATKPGEAKRLGRRVTVRSDWDDIKLKVMEELVRQKFNRHPTLAAKLVATDDAELVEGNGWGDRFWGVSPVGSTGTGFNHLGRILMKVRADMQVSAATEAFLDEIVR